MNKLFDFKDHDLIKFKTKLNGDRIFEFVVRGNKQGLDHDLVVVPGFDFLRVTENKITCNAGDIELVEVYRFDGDVYRRVYKKD